MSASKFIWTSKALSDITSAQLSTYADSLMFSSNGWFATHETKFYLPLVDAATSATALTSATAMFTKDGNYRTLPANAFVDTTYTASTTTASESSVVTSFGLEGTNFDAKTTNISAIKLDGYTASSVTTDIAATDSLGEALAKLQAKINATEAVADAGMSFLGVTTSTTSFSTATGSTYIVGAEGKVPSGVTAAVGDTIVYDGSAWQVIPSGDDARYASVAVGSAVANATTSGSVLSFANGAKTTVALSGDSDATITFSHATANALSIADGSATTLAFGGSAVNIVTEVATDGYGHLTGYTLTPVALPALTAAATSGAASWGVAKNIGSITIGDETTTFSFTLPANPNSVTSLAASATATGANGGATIATTESNSVAASTSVVKIAGSGTVSVDYSETDGIVISAADDSRVTALGVASAADTNDVTLSLTNSDASIKTATMLLDESFTYGANGLDIVWVTI